MEGSRRINMGSTARNRIVPALVEEETPMTTASESIALTSLGF